MFLSIPLALLRLFIFLQIQNKYFSRVYSKFVLSLVRPLLTQNVEWVEIPMDGTNSKILATFISFPFHGAGMRTCLVHGHRLFTFSLWRTAWLCFKEILQVKILDTMGYFYRGLVGGNSHFSPGDFLTVFSLLTCPGDIFFC